MSRWFRLYDDLVDDPKIQRLPGETVKALLNLWCLASQNDGMLPAVDDIAFKLRMKPAKVEQLLSVLGECGLIDSDEEGLRPHNWNARQYKSDVADPTAASRQKAYRDRLKNRNATVTVTGTRAETEQITDSETEQKTKTAPKVADGWPENFGDIFWKAYPRKEEKISAMKKLATLRKSGIVTFSDLMAGVQRYCAVQREPQFTKQPTVWLNKGCWADEIQTGATNGNRTGNTRTTGHDAILAVAARKARELDRNDEVAGATAAPGFARGDGIDAGGSDRDHGATEANHRDHHRDEPDDQRIREGEIIPPDKDAAGIPRSGQFL